MVNHVSTRLDEDQLNVYVWMGELLREATRGRADAARSGAQALDAFEIALASGPSAADPVPWRRFIEGIGALIEVLETGPLLNVQRPCMALLEQIYEENRDLLRPLVSETALP